MSRAKLFNLIKSRGENKIGRNTFDLTNRHVYTSKAGKIVPIKALHTYPDDYFEVNLSEFSQNNIPMNTAAFLSGKKELLAYFVPYNTIWHNFNQYQATREDPDSTLLKEHGISYEPRIRLYTLYDNALYFAIGLWLFKDYSKLLALRSIVLEADSPLTLTDGMTASEIIALASQTPAPSQLDVDLWSSRCNSMYWTMRYDYLYKDFFSLQSDTFPLGVDFYCREFSKDHDETLSMFDTYTNILGNFIWCDWCQKMDMLGYGNIYPILKTFLDKMEKTIDDMLTSSVYHTSPSLTFTYDDVEYNLIGNSFDVTATPKLPIFTAIVEEFRNKLGTFTHYTDSEGEPQPEYVNVYAIYAYNKCFYEFMRNVYFDTNYSVYNYNCDFINGNSLEGSTIIGSDLPLRWYHLESHQWKKDMFTGVLPDNQLGQVSELILNAGSDGTQAATLDVDLDLVGNVTPQGSVSVNSTFTGESSPSGYPAYIGSAGFADDNTTGVLRSQGDGNPPIYDGGVPSGVPFQVRQVHTHTSVPSGTVTSQGSFTGESSNVNFSGSKASIQIPSLTGSGAAVLNVLALKRAEAIQQYRQDLMRAGNRTQDVFKQVYGTTPKSELDEAPYFIEVESNDINVNPIISTAQTGSELNGKLGDIAARVTIGGSSLNFKFSTKDFGVVIFMSYIVPESFYNSFRLDPFVTHLDQEAHGLPYFQNLGLQPVLGSSLNNLQPAAVRHSTRGFAPPYLERKTDVDLVHGNLVDFMLGENGVVDVNYQGSLSHWVVARTDMQEEKTLSLRNFYINPRILDNVFTFNAQDDYETDHFLNYASIQIAAVRAFSELGLPRF